MSQVSYTLSLYLHLHPPPQLSATVCTCLPLEGGQATFSIVYNCHNMQTVLAYSCIFLRIPALLLHIGAYCVFLLMCAYRSVLSIFKRILAYFCVFLHVLAYHCVFLCFLAYLSLFEHIGAYRAYFSVLSVFLHILTPANGWKRLQTLEKDRKWQKMTQSDGIGQKVTVHYRRWQKVAEDHGKRLQTAENGCDSNDQCCDSYGHYCDSYGQCCDSYNIFILIDEGAKPREARRAFQRRSISINTFTFHHINVSFIPSTLNHLDWLT